MDPAAILGRPTVDALVMTSSFCLTTNDTIEALGQSSGIGDSLRLGSLDSPGRSPAAIDGPLFGVDSRLGGSCYDSGLTGLIGDPMALKWIAVDIDGTMLDSSGQLPPGNVAAIRQALDRGIEVFLVTGRRFGAAVWVAEALDLPSPLIVNNGAMIKCPIRSRRLAQWFLEPEAARAILSTTASFAHCTVLHKDRPAAGQLVVCARPRTNGQLHHYLNKVPQATVQVESLRNEIDSDLIEIMFSGPLDLMEAVESCLKESGLHQSVRIAKTYYWEKNLGIIDVLNKGCSKRSALDFWARSHGIEATEILAIGDNHSDLEMLEYAGVGVVMANGVEDLKGRGFHETASNNNLGVAQAIRRFILQG